MKYILKQKVTGNKNRKFLYEIVNETGEVINTRQSNREYVAATIDTKFFFGRLDLIGKGTHGFCVKSGYDKPIAYHEKMNMGGTLEK